MGCHRSADRWRARNQPWRGRSGGWGRALREFPDWQIFASPEVLEGGSSVDGFQLFTEPDPHQDRVHHSADLHLTVSVRSIRAKEVSASVNAVLSGDGAEAQKIAAGMRELPVVTRDLDRARLWLRSRQLGRTRSGLVASSAATRLRADGMEAGFDFHKGFGWEHWFLDHSECVERNCDHKYCGDVRASSKLEVCATQFEIQGLELDWVGVCWGDDLVWDGAVWRSQSFNSKQWATARTETLKDLKRRERLERKHRYRLNGYRVLLTRARQGMTSTFPVPPESDEKNGVRRRWIARLNFSELAAQKSIKHKATTVSHASAESAFGRVDALRAIRYQR